MKKSKTIFAIAALMSLAISHAQEAYPTRGLIYHTTENSSLQYDCKLLGQELHCDMTQTFVRQQVPQEKLAQRSKELLDSLIKSEPRKGECDEISKTGQQLAEFMKDPSKLPQESKEEFRRMPDAQKKSIQQSITLAERACRTRDKATIETFRDHLLKDEASTCRVGSHSWKEVFQRASSSAVWTTKDSPSGDCGIVLLNRFELVSAGSGNLKFWQYISRKAVTNPSGTTGLNMQCKDLDEGTYTYSWKSRELFLGCNTIKFSVL